MTSGKKTRLRRNSSQEKGIDVVIEGLHLLSSSSDEDGESSQGGTGEDIDSDSQYSTTFPKCGIRYGAEEVGSVHMNPMFLY